MFEHLMASSSASSRSLGQSAASVAVHLVVIAGAVQVTKGAATEVTRWSSDTTMIYVSSPAPEAPVLPTPAPETAIPEGPSIPAPAFTDVGVPGLPTIDLPARPFNPGAYATSRPADRGTVHGDPGAEITTGEVFLSSQLDDPAQRMAGPEPRFPPALADAGISGSVDLEYVVDTTGHAESNSLQVVAATHEAFIESAREAVLKSSFRPARYRGTPVRQQVRQRITFRSPGT